MQLLMGGFIFVLNSRACALAEGTAPFSLAYI
jgi:hypothetical protein